MLLTRPAPDDQGNLTVTWRLIKGDNSCFGWAVPDLDPNTRDTHHSHGSFINGSGDFFGLGTQVIGELPNGVFPSGGLLSLRYDPAQGTMHARVNGGAEVLSFTDLRNDLVPAVCLIFQGESCAIVVRYTHNIWLVFIVSFSVGFLYFQ